MRRSGVRIPLAPPQADIRSRMSFFCMFGRVGAVPGCCVARGAAGVPGVARAVLWAGLLVVPVGGGPPAVTGPGCLWLHGCSGRRRDRPPARLGVLTSFGAAPRSPPVPSGPSGALHTCGAGSLFGSSTRRLVVRPGLATARWHRSQAPQALHPALAHIAAGLTRNVACNSPATCSSHEIITLELQRFQTLLKLHPIELHAFFGGKNLPPPSALRLGSRSLRCPPY